MLPPCSNVLKQHIIRINSQTLIWRKCLDNFMVLSQPWEIGWFINEETLEVKWITCNPPPEHVVFFWRGGGGGGRGVGVWNLFFNN